MNAKSALAAAFLATGLFVPAVAIADPPEPGPAVPANPNPAPAPAPRPNPAPPAADPSDPEVAGVRCLDEAARWIAKGGVVPERLITIHTDIDYVYDDGSNHDERRMELWFRNPDAFRANTTYGGRDSTLLLVGERGFMIRDRLHVTELNTSGVMKELLPMMKNYRDILREVGRLMAPAGLKGPGARFRLLGTIADPRATGGQWFKVVRSAPREGDMTFFFGTAPTKDGRGLRAIAPDKLIIAGPPGSNYAGDEYRLEDWVHDPVEARAEQFRYPRKIRLYAIGLDPENKPTMRANTNFLEVNTPIDPDLLVAPY
jgi:hypothetical protein